MAPIALPSSSLFSSAITPKNIIDLTNQARQNLDLATLRTNEVLARAAAEKAADMLRHQYFAHTSPAGITPWEWFKKVGYKYRYAGENLAVHFYEAEDVQVGWMASPAHRANIVNPNYTQIGVGVVTGNFEGVATTFVVQLFGTPAAEAESPATVAASSSAPRVVPVEAGSVAGVKDGSSSPQPTKLVLQPSIIESSFVALPKADGYEIKIDVKNATAVEATLGVTRVSLVRLGDGDTWKGTLATNMAALSSAGEPISLLATNQSGLPASATLALLSPSADTQHLYIFNEGTSRFTTILGGLRINNLNDGIRRFYVGFIVFLSAALVLNLLLARFRLHHPTMVSHSVAVIILAVILLVF